MSAEALDIDCWLSSNKDMGIVSAEGEMKYLLTFLSAAVIFSYLDLLWLGVVMGDFYNTQLGALKAAPVLVMRYSLLPLLSWICGLVRSC